MADYSDMYFQRLFSGSSGGSGATTGAGKSPCVLIIIIVLLFLSCAWLCYSLRDKPGNSNRVALFGDKSPSDAAGHVADLRCGIPGSEKPSDANSAAPASALAMQQTADVAPQINAGAPINNSIASIGPAGPNFGESQETTESLKEAAGTPYMASAFAPSEASADFYATFQPAGLASMMPASWRPSGQNCGAVAPAQEGASSVETNFDEFSRYTVAPSQVQKAETMRGTIRLAELTSTRNARTLGEPSLLRNAVTPLSPVPIGSDAFIFSDSSQRQGYIAAATGRYPEQIAC